MTKSSVSDDGFRQEALLSNVYIFTFFFRRTFNYATYDIMHLRPLRVVCVQIAEKKPALHKKLQVLSGIGQKRQNTRAGTHMYL